MTSKVIKTSSVSSMRDSSCSDRLRMKDSPELYQISNAERNMDVVNFLEQYKNKLKWKQRGDRSIDLGCAEGSTTMTLEKFLPPNYEALVGCDLNEKSVRFANEKYGCDRVKFRLMDIQGELPNDLRQGFDHVFSFYAINWVRDQEKAFRNIYDLLVKDGDCLLMVLSRHPIHDMYLALAQSQRWAAYLKKVDYFVSPYHDCQEPDSKISKMMEKIGFKNVDVKCKQVASVYDSVEAFKKILIAMDPFHIPEELMGEFLADAEGVLRDMRLLHRTEQGVELMKSPYNLLVINANK